MYLPGIEEEVWVCGTYWAGGLIIYLGFFFIWFLSLYFAYKATIRKLSSLWGCTFGNKGVFYCWSTTYVLHASSANGQNCSWRFMHCAYMWFMCKCLLFSILLPQFPFTAIFYHDSLKNYEWELITSFLGVKGERHF